MDHDWLETPGDELPPPASGGEILSTGEDQHEPYLGEDLFSPHELSAIRDGTPFRVRARVVARMRLVFDGLRHQIARHLAQGHYLAPATTDRKHGKLGGGEYLGGTPYVYLDIPRYFEGETSFTFRTLFWWGHGVSFSLILSGAQLGEYRQRLLRNLDVLSALDVHLSAGDHPWDWEHGPGHTLEVGPDREAEIVRLWRAQSFLKCSRFLGFEDEEFRRCRIDQAALLTFRALEPLILA